MSEGSTITSGDVDATVAATHGVAPAASEDEGVRVGDRIGRYVLLEEIGRGAMGRVFTAYDDELDRKVALKFVPGRGGALTAPRREAQALAKVVHPNVVTVHDVGEHAGGLFIAMEYLPGGTLADRLAEGERPWPRIVADFVAAAHGLAAAHEAGLVHRDFKPANVLFDAAGRIKVADFGLAVPSTSGPSEDEGGLPRLRGTPAYMAPEQFTAAPVDARADQFALCVALYEALWRVRPFGGSTVTEIATEVVTGEAREPPRSRVPASIRRAVLRGLAREPEARFPSMNDLVAALDHGRRSRRLRVGAFGLLVAGGLGAAVVGHSVSGSARCHEGAARIARDWGPNEERELRAVLADGTSNLQTARADAVVAALDDYATRWAAAFDGACRVEADGGTVAPSQRVCLDRGRRSLVAVVGAVEDGAALDSAHELVRMLVDPAGCAHEASSPAMRALLQDAERVPAVVDALAVIDRARVERLVGRMQQAQAQLDEAQTRADALDADYVTASVQLERAALALDRDRTDEADAPLQAAFEAGLRVADPGLQALAAERWMLRERAESDWDGCDRWYGIARAALGAAQASDRDWIALSLNAKCALGRGDVDGQRAIYEEALRRAERLDPPDDALRGDVLYNLGSLEWKYGDLERADALLADAERAWGDTHPPGHRRWFALAELRMVLRQRSGDLQGAAEIAERSWEVRRETHGPDHADTLREQIIVAVFDASLGRADAAKAKLDDVQARLDAPGVDLPLHRATWRAARSTWLQTLDRLDDAIAEGDLALDELDARAEPLRAPLLLAAAQMRLLGGRPDEAEAYLDRYAEQIARDGATADPRAACWATLVAVARGDRAQARLRAAAIDLDTDLGRSSSELRAECGLARLAVEPMPDPAEVAATLRRLREIEPAYPATHRFAARVLERP